MRMRRVPESNACHWLYRMVSSSQRLALYCFIPFCISCENILLKLNLESIEEVFEERTNRHRSLLIFFRHPLVRCHLALGGRSEYSNCLVSPDTAP